MTNETALKLKAIAVLAEVTALKVERRQNSPGEVSAAVMQIQRLLVEVKERR
jgi:hypothetical protein